MAAAEVAASAAPLVVTGKALRQGLEEALRALSEQKAYINELNVFPVPDGDTGSNMHLTLEAACQEVNRLAQGAPVSAVAKAAAHGALMGARGNSGVILSQVLRGWSLSSQESETLDLKALVNALEEGSRVAFSAVKRPVEGTMLSVARDSAQAAQKVLEAGGDQAQLADAVVAEAWAAVDRSTDQMDVLRDAGVVDAGGFGLAVILGAIAERIGASRRGSSGPPKGPKSTPARPKVAERRGAAAAVTPEGGFGYCTEFALLAADLEAVDVRSQLGDEAADDSALVVGEPGLLHIHLHTKEPWVVLTKAAKLGQIERLKVEDMTAQHERVREQGSAEAPALGLQPVGVVALAQGDGFRELLLGLGAASVVEGGQSQNPSTEQILQGLEGAGVEEILLLPNNPNLIMGVEQAAQLFDRTAAVVPSRNLPQGIAALLAFDSGAPLEVNRQRMERAMAGVHAIEVTQAVRDSHLGDREVKVGALIGLLDGQLVSTAAGVEEVVVEALRALPKGSIEVVTLYRGAEVKGEESESLEAAIRKHFPDLEVERHDGGQALYQFVISAE
jgi:hypothetical protein